MSSRTAVRGGRIGLALTLLLVSFAQAINYEVHRHDAVPTNRNDSVILTSRDFLEQLNFVEPKASYTLQEATEHLLQFGALLRARILDTFGSLLYVHYDDFSVAEVEALRKVHLEILERRYDVFDLVPGVLRHSDTRPSTICAEIYERTAESCLRSSANVCRRIKRQHDLPHPDDRGTPAVNVTYRIYRLAKISRQYPRGFSLAAILRFLQRESLTLTPGLLSGLLCNVRFEDYDDDVRLAERELVRHFRGKVAGKTGAVIPTPAKEDLRKFHTVDSFLKYYIDTYAEKFLDNELRKYAFLVARRIADDIGTIDENIHLLGNVYENQTIHVGYLFDLVLPDDLLENDVIEAKKYLVTKLNKFNVVERYLRVQKYQQVTPAQLTMELTGQLRDIDFAKSIATSLRTHARFWHASRMIENLDELLELFDAYENLRQVPRYLRMMRKIDEIKKSLRDMKDIPVEILCNAPRACLRIGLQLVLRCKFISSQIKDSIKDFLELSDVCVDPVHMIQESRRSVEIPFKISKVRVNTILKTTNAFAEAVTRRSTIKGQSETAENSESTESVETSDETTEKVPVERSSLERSSEFTVTITPRTTTTELTQKPISTIRDQEETTVAVTSTMAATAAPSVVTTTLLPTTTTASSATTLSTTTTALPTTIPTLSTTTTTLPTTTTTLSTTTVTLPTTTSTTLPTTISTTASPTTTTTASPTTITTTSPTTTTTALPTTISTTASPTTITTMSPTTTTTMSPTTTTTMSPTTTTTMSPTTTTTVLPTTISTTASPTTITTMSPTTTTIMSPTTTTTMSPTTTTTMSPTTTTTMSPTTTTTMSLTTTMTMSPTTTTTMSPTTTTTMSSTTTSTTLPTTITATSAAITTELPIVDAEMKLKRSKVKIINIPYGDDEVARPLTNLTAFITTPAPTRSCDESDECEKTSESAEETTTVLLSTTQSSTTTPTMQTSTHEIIRATSSESTTYEDSIDETTVSSTTELSETPIAKGDKNCAKSCLEGCRSKSESSETSGRSCETSCDSVTEDCDGENSRDTSKDTSPECGTESDRNCGCATKEERSADCVTLCPSDPVESSSCEGDCAPGPMAPAVGMKLERARTRGMCEIRDPHHRRQLKRLARMRAISAAAAAAAAAAAGAAATSSHAVLRPTTKRHRDRIATKQLYNLLVTKLPYSKDRRMAEYLRKRPRGGRPRSGNVEDRRRRKQRIYRQTKRQLARKFSGKLAPGATMRTRVTPFRHSQIKRIPERDVKSIGA